jgi:hypothetical protein
MKQSHHWMKLILISMKTANHANYEQRWKNLGPGYRTLDGRIRSWSPWCAYLDTARSPNSLVLQNVLGYNTYYNLWLYYSQHN